MDADEHAFYTSKKSVLLNVTRETFYINREHFPLIFVYHLTRFDRKSTACFWLRFGCLLAFTL